MHQNGVMTTTQRHLEWLFAHVTRNHNYLHNESKRGICIKIELIIPKRIFYSYNMAAVNSLFTPPTWPLWRHANTPDTWAFVFYWLYNSALQGSEVWSAQCPPLTLLLSTQGTNCFPTLQLIQRCKKVKNPRVNYYNINGNDNRDLGHHMLQAMITS